MTDALCVDLSRRDSRSHKLTKDDPMLKNLPTLADIVADPSLAIGLDISTMAALLEDADAQRQQAEAAKKVLVTILRDDHKAAIGAAYAEKDSDFGTVHVTIAGYDLEVTTQKKVDWDQAGLAALEAEMRKGGDDPAEYIAVERKVEEKKFVSWPSFLQKQFLPHRVTKPGSVSLKLAKIEPAELV